jgi:aminoglycoside/choline kinase family phosphotransferase
MAERDAEIARFLDTNGWAEATHAPLAGDASFRRYIRLTDGFRRAMLMDGPPPQENVRSWLAVARHLGGLGFSAPRVFAADADAGLALIEDFGDDTYTRLLDGGGDERALLALAVDVLIALHRIPPDRAIPPSLPPYDDRRLFDEAGLLVEWYAPAVMAELPEAAVSVYFDLWRRLLPIARAVPETLVLRDFHVDNLMGLAGREGIEACGLLDFQDAVTGPVSYDLISLIEDARRDFQPGLADELMARYLAAFPDLDPAAFAASAAVLAALRNAKIIGIFTRLAVRDAKPAYLAHIPRVWCLLEGDLAHPVLGPMRDWFGQHFPADARRVPDVEARP